MRTLRVRTIDSSGCFFDDKNKYYSMPRKQLIEYFLPQKYQYQFVSVDESADICLFSIQLFDTSLLRKNELNILICIENCSHWHWYHHYNRFGNYGDDMIDIYMYNHIHKLERGQYMNHSQFVAIPTIHLRINYFLETLDQFRVIPELNIPFTKKKFCLMTNKSRLNGDVNKLVTMLEKIGTVDNISIYNDQIENETCYNGIELLKVFSQYKFIMCIENSYGLGYITEKIFNSFFAGSVPIYCGSPSIEEFLNIDSFINVSSKDMENLNVLSEKIKELGVDQNKYVDMMNECKISKIYDDENYKKHIDQAFISKLNIHLS